MAGWRVVLASVWVWKEEKTNQDQELAKTSLGNKDQHWATT
jgi:hypothetical protein